MSDAHAVEVDRLHVVRGGRNALDGITLDVARGTVTGLLGPSGSGKSTLMRAIVGTQLVTSGSVTVLGEPAGSPGLRGRVAYTTQSPAVYDDLTVPRTSGTSPAWSGRPTRRRTRSSSWSASATMPAVSSAGSRAASAPASRSRRRSSDGPSCSFSTSRRSASTRSCGATSGRRSRGLRPTGRRSSSRATSWTRPSAATSSCSSAAGGSSPSDAAAEIRAARRRRVDGRGLPTARRDRGDRVTRGAVATARSRAPAGPPRPPHDRAAAARPVRAHRPARLALRRPAGRLRPHRRTAARALPLHRDVPRHVDHDAAGAHDGDARAADDPAAHEARAARRIQRRVRARRDGAGGARLRARVPPARARRRRLPVVDRSPGDPERVLGTHSACSRARSPAPSSRPSSSCRRS